jgi:hypothetical protein
MLFVDETPGIDELNSIESLAAEVALITPGILLHYVSHDKCWGVQFTNVGATMRTCSFHKTISQKSEQMSGPILARFYNITDLSQPVQYVCSFDCFTRYPFLPRFA